MYVVFPEWTRICAVLCLSLVDICFAAGDLFTKRRRDCCGRMVVGFTTIYAISANHHYNCEFELRSWRDNSQQQYVIKFVRESGQVGGFLRIFRCFQTNKSDRHDIAEIC